MLGPASIRQDQLHFIERKELGISYPTVSVILDEIISGIRYSSKNKPEMDKKKICIFIEKR